MPEISSQPSIHLVTGYLGSGKTQFLSRLLERPLLQERVAVIVNDFGTVMFDGLKLTSAVRGDNTVEILDVPGGCLCCSAIDDFQRALHDVIGRGARRIFIEATGLADAEQVQRDLAFMRFPIDSTLCIVDALNLRRFQKLFHIVNAQIKAADVLLISKSDLVKKPDSTQLLEDELRILNPRAMVHRLDKGRADAPLLLQLFAPAERFIPDIHPHIQEHLLHDGVTAFRIVLPESVDFPMLERMLADIPIGLVRIKGLLRFDNSPKPILLNFIAGAWNYQPLDEGTSAPNELFAIGQNVVIDDVQSRFQALGARVEGGTVRSLGLIDHEHHTH
ncbi:MAG: GTP-binding protein [Candidatus Kapabacteria bacterium]|jgi:G3E family GTPase|nr:GTP-binding protein [Candidatus Kapabacteria bacterium]